MEKNSLKTDNQREIERRIISNKKKKREEDKGLFIFFVLF